jgi:hypothetical protein
MKEKLFVPKGSYGYMENRKLMTTLRTLLYFVLCIGLYLLGYVTTGSNKNLLTIVAILGTLPACKSAVNMIIFLRARGCSARLQEQVCPYDTVLTTFYDLYFTTYQKNFAVSHMVLKGNVLCGVTENPKCDAKDVEEHLEHMMAQEGIKNVTVKIFSDVGKYVDRLGQLTKLETEEGKKQDDVVNLLYSISL